MVPKKSGQCLIRTDHDNLVNRERSKVFYIGFIVGSSGRFIGIGFSQSGFSWTRIELSRLYVVIRIIIREGW